jgi:hypothetical protein
MFPSPDASAAAPAVAPAVESGSNRTMLLAVGGVGAALIVGAGAFFLLNSGGTDPAPTAAGIPSRTSAASAAPSPSASPSAKPAVIRPASVSVSARDPFKPLFAAAKASTAPTSAPSTAPTSAPTPVPTPVTPSVTLAVSKINTVKQTATVTVDGKAYATTIGAVFGKNFVMYSVFNAQCIGVLFGDQSVPVCTNSPQTVSP